MRSSRGIPASRVAEHFVFVLESLRRHLEVQRDELARRVFHDLLRSGEMRFLVVTEALHPLRLPAETVVPMGRQANREDGSPYVGNLFDRTTEDELNGLENRVASWIDGQERLYFWYRNRARKDYFVQGWKRDRIYPDFLWTLRPDPNDDGDEGGAIRGDDDRAEDGGKFDQVFVVETKGLHLEESKDTDYKKCVFAPLREARAEDELGRVRARDARGPDALRGRRGERLGAAPPVPVRRPRPAVGRPLRPFPSGKAPAHQRGSAPGTRVIRR